MVFTGRRNVDDFALHGFYQWRIFPLRVDNNNIRIGICEDDIGHFLFCRKGFTCTRHTENKGVSVEQVAAVGNNHVLTDHILPVIYTVLVVDLLHPERDKYGKAFRCQRAQGIDLTHTKRQRRVQSVHLLIFQHRKLTQVLSGSRKQSFGVIVKLFLCFRRMHHRQHRKTSFSGHGS